MKKRKTFLLKWVWGVFFKDFPTHFSYLYQVATDVFGMCLSQALIFEYCCTDFIQLILLKHFDQGLISILVWVHISLTYRQKEILKINFKLGGQAINTTHFSFAVSVTILALLNFHKITYQIWTCSSSILEASDDSMILLCASFHDWNSNNRRRHFFIR